MLLTITYFGQNASDLGYLLHKNPYRAQKFDLNFGKVYIFYPEIKENSCTVALLLDIDPLDLTRGKIGSKEKGLFDYVNDRPYVSSSFMSVAISRVFGTAMSGKCEKRKDLVDMPLDFQVFITMLPCRADARLLFDIFEPLGYQVSFTIDELDEKFPEWGKSIYVDLTLRGKQKLKDLLRHLYVLIPVFDKRKHYYIGKDEVDKLLYHGEGWLEDHPQKAIVTRRYFDKVQYLTQIALDRLDNGEGLIRGSSDEEITDMLSPPNTPFTVEKDDPMDQEGTLFNLNTRRLGRVIKILKDRNVSSVIDIGCGEGKLLSLLLKEKSITKIAGTDVSILALDRVKERLKIDKLPEVQQNRITLFQSSLFYRDCRFSGYDCATIIEVIEHLDENRLNVFTEVIFGNAKPRIVIITTPNIEYNKNYPNFTEKDFRHKDHRFEWNNKQFQEWAFVTAKKYNYEVEYEKIGNLDEYAESPTQMGVFTLCK